MSLKKILIILLGLTVILGGCFLGCMYHNNSAKQSYGLAKDFVAKSVFNSDSSLKYIKALDASSCLLCMDGFHQEDSVLQLVTELKMQDTICQIFAVVCEKLQSSRIDFSDLLNTKIAIDSFPQVKNGSFMYDESCAQLYAELNDLCTVGLFMDNVSNYLQTDEWNYSVLNGHLKQLLDLDIVSSGAYTEPKYKNFLNRYNQLVSDRKLRSRLNRGEFWELVELFNEEGIDNLLFAEKYALLKDFVQDEAFFAGFYNRNKNIIKNAGFSQVQSLWNDYKAEKTPVVAETEAITEFEIEMQAPAEKPVVEEKPVVSEPVKKTEPKSSTVKTASSDSKKTTTKKSSEKQTKPTAAANRSYSDMMYGDAVAMDEGKTYSSDADVLDVISTRSALYQLNKNNVIGSSLKAKVQSLKNQLEKVTESEYSHCYSSASSLSELNEALTKISQNR